MNLKAEVSSGGFFKIVEMKGDISAGGKNSKSIERIVEYQINITNLCTCLNESNSFLIIDDFHKVDLDERMKLIDKLKTFNQREAKLIIMGAVSRLEDLVQIEDDEFNNRVTPMYFDYFEQSEIFDIIELGEQLLNIEIDEKIKSIIVGLSKGKPAVCHQICYNICHLKGIKSRARVKYSFSLDDLIEAVYDVIYTRRNEYERKFRKIFEEKDRDENLSVEILKAMFRSQADEVSFEQLKQFMEVDVNDKKLMEEVFERLEEMTLEKYGNILEKNIISNGYSFVDPFFQLYSFDKLKNVINKFYTLAEGEIEAPYTITNNKLLQLIGNRPQV